MKKLMFMVAGGIFIASLTAQNVSTSQPNYPHQKKQHLTPEQRAQRSVNELDAIVGLSSDQKTKVYTLALNRVQSVDAIRKKYKGQPNNQEQEKAEIKEIRKKYRHEVKAILTPAQIEKLKQHHLSKNPKGNSNVEEMIPNSSDQN
ncbi:MAG: hypothetical protein N2203_07450 [Bacteroidia bacterium]|nr:hypothetical protein [Bacteroidia bacterium]